MNAPDVNQWDAAADAILKVWKGGGLQLCLALLAAIVFWRKPWFRDAPKP